MKHGICRKLKICSKIEICSETGKSDKRENAIGMNCDSDIASEEGIRDMNGGTYIL